MNYFVNRISTVVFAATVSLAIVFGFTLSPRCPKAVEKSNCVAVYDLAGPVHLTINGDSWEFLRLARHPGLIMLENHEMRRSRPGYALLGWCFSWPVKAVFSVLPIEKNRYHPLLPQLIGYILLNWMLLTVSLMFLLQTGTSARFTTLILPVTILLANQLTKAFFWTPHLQLFNVFIPLCTIFLCYRLLTAEKDFSIQTLVGLGLVLGFGCSTYGAFFVAIACIGLILWWAGKGTCIKKSISTGVFIVSAIVPVVLWVIVVRQRTGGFYSDEIERWHQFVWIAYSIQQGCFWESLWNNIQLFTRTLTPLIFPLVCTGIATLCEFVIVKNRWTLAAVKSKWMLSIAVFYAIEIPFLVLMGFYTSRLTWILVVPILIVLLHQIENIQNVLIEAKCSKGLFIMNTCLCITALVYLVYWYCSIGPWA